MVDADNAFYNLEFNKVSTKNRCRYETVWIAPYGRVTQQNNNSI
jgi:hypothetical protein